MGWKETAAETAQLLNLKSSNNLPVFFGKINEFPSQLFHVHEDKVDKIKLLVNFQKGQDLEILKTKIENSLAENKEYKSKSLVLDGDLLVYTFIKGMFDKRTKEQFSDFIKTLINSLKEAGTEAKKNCSRCTSAVENPILFNGELTVICASCLETARQQIDNEKRKYDKIEINFTNVLLAGIVSAIVGAAVWAGAAVFTGKMYALLAIGIGLIVGHSMYYVAKKKSNKVLTGVFIFTILSVILGNILCYAFFFNEGLKAEGFQFDLNIFLQFLPQIMHEGISDTLFAGFCGLLGATGAAKISDKYSPPAFNVESLV